MGADGNGQRRLGADDDGPREGESVYWQMEPAWSPDATEIAYTGVRKGVAHIFVMDADGSGARALTSGRANDTHATWSPDGKHLAFARDGDIYVMSSGGSDAKAISDVPAPESDPAWSPDGRWIAYISGTPGTPVQNLWLMRPNGTGRHALTRQGGRAYTPGWSPDGRRIVFSMNLGGKLFELFTIGVDGKRLRRLVGTTHDNFDPAWSPDGSRIAYQEERAIFTIAVDGGDVEKLTKNATNNLAPAWSPTTTTSEG